MVTNNLFLNYKVVLYYAESKICSVKPSPPLFPTNIILYGNTLWEVVFLKMCFIEQLKVSHVGGVQYIKFEKWCYRTSQNNSDFHWTWELKHKGSCHHSTMTDSTPIFLKHSYNTVSRSLLNLLAFPLILYSYQ